MVILVINNFTCYTTVDTLWGLPPPKHSLSRGDPRTKENLFMILSKQHEFDSMGIATSGSSCLDEACQDLVKNSLLYSVHMYSHMAFTK